MDNKLTNELPIFNGDKDIVDAGLMNNSGDNDLGSIYSFNINTKKLIKMNREIPNGIQNQFATPGSNSYDLIKPAYDTHMLEWLSKVSPTHRACINLKPILIAGFGFDIRNNTDKKIVDEINEFLLYPNDVFGNTAAEIIQQIAVMYSIYGYADILINKVGGTKFIYAGTNVKNTFVRAAKHPKGGFSTKIKEYAQLNNNGTISATYKPYYRGCKNGSYILRISGNYVSNSYYADPTYIAAKLPILEDYLIDMTNNKFFSNGGQGNILLYFTGGKLNETNQQKMESFYSNKFSELRGVDNAGRMLVMSRAGKDAKVEKLDISTPNVNQYSDTQQAKHYTIARAHNILPKLISLISGGSSGFQGGTADIGQLFLQNQIMIRPEQFRLEEKLNLLCYDLFNYNPQIKLRTIDTNNQKDMAVIASMLYGSGQVGLKESREYIHKHGIMEIDPSVNPDDLKENDGKGNTVLPNVEGEIRGDGSLESDPDGIYNQEPNKFE